MSNLSKEQVTELTERINGRFAEFDVEGSRVFEWVTPGVVRLVFDVINEWCMDDACQREEARLKADAAAYERGREAMRKELGMLEQLGRVTQDQGQWLVPSPSIIIDQDQLRADIRDLGAAYPSLEDQPNGNDIFEGVHPVAGGPEPDVVGAMQVVAVADDPSRYANGNGHHSELSDATVATLGPEHTVVTPMVPRRPEPVVAPEPKVTPVVPAKPRTLAEVDKEALQTSRMTASERSAQLREIVGCLQDMADGDEMPSMATWDERKPTHLPKADAITKQWDFSWGELAVYCRLKYTGKRVAKGIGR